VASTHGATLAPRRTSRYSLRFIALAYLAVVVLIPLVVVFYRVFDQGLSSFWTAITSDQAVTSYKLTGVVAGSAVLIDIVFGVGAALLLTRYHYRGRRLFSLLIDLPISVSPIVVGLALVLVYGPVDGWFGKPLNDAGIQIIFATPGMILATAFVSLPLVVREVVPVLEEEGIDQEQAARVLGAGPWQRFWRITLPTIKWGLAYGIVLSIARSIGEYGAVKVVSGNVSGTGSTQTTTLYVDQQVEQLTVNTAYQVSIVLILVAVAAIVFVSFIRPTEGSKS
jgi:sulfate/thiosulfate transport system permease protein